MDQLSENLQKQCNQLQLSTEDLQNIMRNLDINESKNQNNREVQQPYNHKANWCVMRRTKEIKKTHDVPWLCKERAEAIARRRISVRSVQKRLGRHEEF